MTRRSRARSRRWRQPDDLTVYATKYVECSQMRTADNRNGKMPRRLPDRWQAECIREFRASARQRFDDAFALAAAGRRTGAIYLWGYCAEMILKAAYFSVLGVGESDLITLTAHLFPAIDRGRTTFHIAWPRPGQGHNILAWAELLIAERVSLALDYPAPFAEQVQRQGQRIGRLWSETLRYHKNVAYLHEVTQVRESAEWFLGNANFL